MAANPLIAAKEDSTTAYTGISCIETVTGVSDAISSGSWIEAGLGVLGGAADLFSLAVDPLGTLASYGVGWLIEHCEPLQKALNWIAGDPDQIEAYAKTWDNVATRITEVANTQKSAVETDVADWTGQTATAYKSHATDTTNLLSAASSAATTAASAIRLAGGVVAAVRQTVRDLVSQTVARLAVWAAEAVFSLGLATPVIAVQATAYIAKTTAMISKLFSKLAKTMSKLTPLLKKLKSAFGDIASAFKKTKTGGKNTDTTPASTKPKTKGDD
ncbi:WXG100 family type VII secretion target [Nocardia sp. NPDC059177]|uniref:WXG100 family type VII secretion target n=1 Tax=Nocardia sp. NPDC059177 TaxID=3346759 RepID=UPI0036C6B764